MGCGCYSSEEAGWDSKGSREALKDAGRALEAIGRVSKTDRKASQAAGRALEAAGGIFEGKE